MKKKLSLFMMLLLILTMVITPLSANAATIKISKAKATMEVDSILTLKVTGVKEGTKIAWASNKKTIATVDTKGKITALKAGTTTISATVSGKAYSCTVTVVNSNTAPVKNGTRTSPIDLSKKQTFNYMDWSTAKNVTLQLSNVYTGDEATKIIMQENRFNKEPSKGQKWILYEFDLVYNSCDKDESIDGDDLISQSHMYSGDGTKALNVYDTAALSGDRTGLSPYEVELYPGGESKVWYSILVDDSVNTVLLKISSDAKDGYTWFKLNNK